MKSLCELAGSDATIVTTLGGQAGNYQAQRVIIDCAEQTGIKQMVLVTSLGSGDSWVTLSAKAKQAFGHAVREKSLARALVANQYVKFCYFKTGWTA